MNKIIFFLSLIYSRVVAIHEPTLIDAILGNPILGLPKANVPYTHKTRMSKAASTVPN